MSYRVAVTSSDGNLIDMHFGQTRYFHVIQIEEETCDWQEIELRAVDEEAVSEQQGGDYESGSCSGHNDVLLNYIGDLLNDCTYLLTEKIGKKPYKILQQKGINSLESPYDLKEAIEKLNKYYIKNKKQELR
jgi:nitrogen fixation protein NifB